MRDAPSIASRGFVASVHIMVDLPAGSADVELKGGVPNLESVRQAGFSAVEDLPGIGVGGNDQVRGQRHEPAGDAPHVEVMEIDDTGKPWRDNGNTPADNCSIRLDREARI